ncbi:sensor histidine kinase [Maribacter sp. ACAM166]|uniref:sensor histidine kinase n=1 Tax=Maribacter sp. ACAM166 TaxID=2508996 RepID=UPI0010FD8FC7|nr:sensor histidine kinase [Maribacter sp. ACAM166]TLP79163.1 histidine kinase [Maribacter sp. ACAM166]
MNSHKRFIFHIVLWLIIWSTAWFFIGLDFGFLRDNGLSFIVQILTVAALIYYTSPFLLLKKKYVTFILVSLVLVLVGTFMLTNIFPKPGPGIEMGPPIGMERRPPSKFFINLLLITIAYIIATFVETFLFAQRKEEEIIINKNESLQTELKLLKSQINPHFLFNALNNIYALSAIDSGKTQQSISYLSDMLRYVLYECEQEIVPLHKEMDYIGNYIKLFSLKSSKAYPITTSFVVGNENIQIVPMLLIPFLENALKHSNIEKITDTFIRLKINANNNSIDFEIENSKPNTPLVTDAVGGIGIDNVKKRLAILYPKRHQLVIDETSKTFKVNLKLELHG